MHHIYISTAENGFTAVLQGPDGGQGTNYVFTNHYDLLSFLDDTLSGLNVENETWEGLMFDLEDEPTDQQEL